MSQLGSLEGLLFSEKVSSIFHEFYTSSENIKREAIEAHIIDVQIAKVSTTGTQYVNSKLSSKVWGSETKKINLSSLDLNVISVVLFPKPRRESWNFNISKLACVTKCNVISVI